MLKAMIQNDDILDRHGHRYLSQISSKLNISRISAYGDYGIFSSAPNDELILKQYAKTGKWAATTNQALTEFFRDGKGTYLDIGANIGLTVVPIAAKTDVKCYAFEPEPTNFRNLQINIAENCRGTNVTAFQFAAFDRKSSLSFEISPNNLGDHRVRLSGHAGPGFQNEDKRAVIEVSCVRIDDVHLDITPPFFVKIDTQGAEPFVIAGGRRTLALADCILMEWSPYHIRRMGGNATAAIEFLKTNFTTGAIHDDPEAPNSELRFQSISQVCDALINSLTDWPDSKYVDVAIKR